MKRLLSRLGAAFAGTALLSGCGFHGLYSANLPGGANLGSHPYEVVVYFADVMDLVPQSAVKVNDVAVGKVTSIRLSKAGDPSGDPRTNGWTARVAVEVNGDVDLPQNATAAVKMTSLLGEKYVSLQQPPSAPSTARLRDGSTIPITRSGTAPEAEEVLGALSLLLNGGGLEQIHTITTELNKALGGNEASIRDLLTQLNNFAGTLDKQKNDITNALQSIDNLVITLNKQTRTITRTLDTFPRALQILKDERTQLTKALSDLDHLGVVASRVVNETGDTLVSSLKELQPSVEGLTAAGQSLPRALNIAATYPFPIGTTNQALRGDYVNLNLFFDLNLSNQLCGLNKTLCNVTQQLGLPGLIGGDK